MKGVERLLQVRYSRLADVPPEIEWLAITNPNTRRFYKSDVAEFILFTGLLEQSALRSVTRAHVIAWRQVLESRSLTPASIRASSPHCLRCSTSCVSATRLLEIR